MKPDGPPDVEECDYCIVGTGAAGGILAHQLAIRGADVLSLEQGAPIDNSYFTNHLRPEENEHFGITAEMAWPIKPTSSRGLSARQWPSVASLSAKPDTKSTSPASEEQFFNAQIFRLNGKLNLWNAVSLRYSARDFRGKDFGDSDTNWPIGYDDLQQHYTQVERLIGVCGTCEGLEELPDGEFLPPLPLRPADRIVMKAVGKVRSAQVRRGQIRAIPNRKAIETRPERKNHCVSCGECIYGCNSGSVYKFSSHLLPQIAPLANYRIRYQSKVVRLVRNGDSNRIEAVECLDTGTGAGSIVKAKIFVLAAGTLETPRILFNSRDEAFPDGLANSSGTLGCYLQDKVKAMVGTTPVRLAGSRARYDPGCGDHLLIPAVPLWQRNIPRRIPGPGLPLPAQAALLPRRISAVSGLEQKVAREADLPIILGTDLLWQTRGAKVQSLASRPGTRRLWNSTGRY